MACATGMAGATTSINGATGRPFFLTTMTPARTPKKMPPGMPRPPLVMLKASPQLPL